MEKEHCPKLCDFSVAEDGKNLLLDSGLGLVGGSKMRGFALDYMFSESKGKL